MNWKRPTAKVKVKMFRHPIIIDKCCEQLVRRIEKLPSTLTCWCCCGHKVFGGSVEFRSLLSRKELKKKLRISIQRAAYQDRGQYLGWMVAVDCHCSLEIQKAAAKHFNMPWKEPIELSPPS